jgi:hypothetical protein
MFEQVFESVRRAMEASIRVQREMCRGWSGLWPDVPPPPTPGGEQAIGLRKEWTDLVGELLDRQRAAVEEQVIAGLKICEEATHVAGIKNPEERRAKVIELWQKGCDDLRHASEVQIRNVLKVVAKGPELLLKGAVIPKVAAPAA